MQPEPAQRGTCAVKFERRAASSVATGGRAGTCQLTFLFPSLSPALMLARGASALPRRWEASPGWDSSRGWLSRSILCVPLASAGISKPGAASKQTGCGASSQLRARHRLQPPTSCGATDQGVGRGQGKPTSRAFRAQPAL